MISIFRFVLVIVADFIRRQGENYNFAPTFAWIRWWVGLRCRPRGSS
jgi:hypothetical protein